MYDWYPLYKRPDYGIYVEKNGASLDNRWVVPYNPYLCAKYQAHINVEICSSVKAVKYLYTYVYKTMAGIQQIDNEITVTRFVNARYVSA